MKDVFLLNRNLSDQQIEKIHALSDEPILFGIVGEVSKDASYSKNVLLATATHFFTYSLADTVVPPS